MSVLANLLGSDVPATWQLLSQQRARLPQQTASCDSVFAISDAMRQVGFDLAAAVTHQLGHLMGRQEGT